VRIRSMGGDNRAYARRIHLGKCDASRHVMQRLAYADSFRRFEHDGSWTDGFHDSRNLEGKLAGALHSASEFQARSTYPRSIPA